MPDETAVASPRSSASVASMAASMEIVSTGGPVSRNASERSACSPKALAFRERVSRVGLYCNGITRITVPFFGSATTMPALARRGEDVSIVPSHDLEGQGCLLHDRDKVLAGNRRLVE